MFTSVYQLAVCIIYLDIYGLVVACLWKSPCMYTQACTLLVFVPVFHFVFTDMSRHLACSGDLRKPSQGEESNVAPEGAECYLILIKFLKYIYTYDNWISPYTEYQWWDSEAESPKIACKIQNIAQRACFTHF